MTPREAHYRAVSQTVLHRLEAHGITGAYAPDRAAALEQVKTFLRPGVTVSFGGSATLEELGFFDAAAASGCTLLDRRSAETDEERRSIFLQSFFADVYFMSTNALTLDGKLVNIDGRGNRLACLLYGPKKVVVVAGINKLCPDEESAVRRIHMTAAPINCQRLSKRTPCAATGVCADCHSKDCVCAHTVITRHCQSYGRIHVLLVGEALGF